MAQNVTINIENTYCIQVVFPQTLFFQSNMKSIGLPLLIGFLGGVGIHELNKKNGMFQKMAAHAKKYKNIFLGNDDTEDLRKTVCSAKRTNFANTKHSANTNHSENSCNHTDVTAHNNSSSVTVDKANDSPQQTEPNNVDVVNALTEESIPNVNRFVPCQQDVEKNNPEEQVFSQKDEQFRSSAQEKIKYAPLPLPKLFEQYKLKSLNEAFEILYSIGNNSLFQCTRQEFRYWFGGSMGLNFNAETECKRINWKRGRYTLQYFIIQLYRRSNQNKLPKGTWAKVGNVFLLDNKLIPLYTLGKNIDKVGKQDKEDIDNMLLAFEEAMKVSRKAL